jgi:hypothetical protein
MYNKVGGQYSSSETSQRYLDKDTKEILLIDDTIFAEPTKYIKLDLTQEILMFELNNLKTVDFSNFIYF